MTQRQVAFGPAFWSDIAAIVLDRPAVESWVVLTPGAEQGILLREALAARLRMAGHAALRLPRIVVLSDWILSERIPGDPARSPAARRIELYQALEATEWLARHLAAGSARLWALSRQLLALCDQLTLGLVHSSRETDYGPIEARILGALHTAYPELAWSSLSHEAQLVLGIWRATLSRQDGAAILLRGMEQVAERAHAPLLAILAQPPKPYEDAFFVRYARRAPVERVCVDIRRSLSLFFPLAAAWPELVRTEERAPPANLLTRARSRTDAAKPLEHFTMVGAKSLEEEAVCAAQMVLDWLAQGCRRIGLIALDRLVVRRVRALLERAEVIVEDEAGWKYSTTTAAGALMRWLEIVDLDPSHCEARVILDWIKSPYAWSAVVDKEAVAAELELSIRRHNVVHGWSQIEAAIASEYQVLLRPSADKTPQAYLAQVARAGHLQSAATQIAQLRRLAIPLRGRRSLGDHFAWLDQVLEETGMAVSLSKDGVGRAMLRLLAETAAQAKEGPVGGRFGYAEWRDFVSDVLEGSTFRDQAVTSPVVATSLQAAALRAFDGILILGADAAHLPSSAEDSLFLTPALRAQLGLEDLVTVQRQELTQLALLIAATPRVLCTWQTHRTGEARSLAPALERLSMLHKMAFGDDLKRTFEWAIRLAPMTPQYLPRPSAPELLPMQVSASAYNVLTSCPYRYFVRHMLGLIPLEATSEDADKRDYGELVHRILERYHRDARMPQSRADEIQRLRRVSAEIFDQEVGENAAFFGYRQRWDGLVESYVDWWLEWSGQGWQFSAAELATHRLLTLAENPPLTLVGRLDRVDVQPDRIAIVDYKARSRESLRRALKEPGEDVQLPFYRLLLSAVPQTFAFYLSVDRNKVEAIGPSVDLDALSVALGARLGNDFDRLRSGAVLPAHGADSVCIHCDARGLCRKGQWSETRTAEDAESQPVLQVPVP